MLFFKCYFIFILIKLNCFLFDFKNSQISIVKLKKKENLKTRLNRRLMKLGFEGFEGFDSVWCGAVSSALGLIETNHTYARPGAIRVGQETVDRTILEHDLRRLDATMIEVECVAGVKIWVDESIGPVEAIVDVDGECALSVGRRRQHDLKRVLKLRLGAELGVTVVDKIRPHLVPCDDVGPTRPDVRFRKF